MSEEAATAEEQPTESVSLADVLSDKDISEVSVDASLEQGAGEQQTDEEKAEAEKLAAEEKKAAEEGEKSDEEKAAEAKAEEERLAAEAAKPPEDSEEVKGLKAALHAERTKRQDLEKAPPAEKKEFWEDPEGAIKDASQTVEQKLQQTVLTISENAARARHEDFQVNYDAFAVAAQDNPALIDRMLQSPDPAEFVYRTGAKETLLKSMGDPAEYKQKLTAEIKTELQTEYDTKLKDEIAKLAKLPASAAEASGEGNNYAETDGGEVKHKSLAEVLG